MTAATSRMSSSLKPRVVSAGEPSRRPLVTKGESGSKGMVRAASEELLAMRSQMQTIAVLRLSILEQIRDSMVKVMGDASKVSIGSNGNIINELGIHHIDLLPYHTLGIEKYHQLGRDYPYPVTQPLDKKALLPYQQQGQALGLDIHIVV